jgi:tRNA uridine 5-carboxymethylaminomethyl modification enzyme
VAGLNAARRAGSLDGVTFDRTTSYLGVLIDDLVTRGVSEPYRMFTSRSEFRLSLRVDNADERLTPLGLAAGCVGPAREQKFREVLARLELVLDRLRSWTLTPQEAAQHGLSLNRDGIRRSAFQLLSYPDLDWATLARVWPEMREVEPSVADRLASDAQYAVYMDRQRADVAAFKRDEAILLDEGIDYATLSGLSQELRGKLAAVQPTTLGQAARIEGITPAAITLLAAYARRRGSNASRKRVSRGASEQQARS